MRHARELALQQGKRLRIQIEAAGAQVERSILDELGEPLAHLVRNAVDHGIEAPSERGDKDPEARLVLHAEPSGANVVLSIIDDGRGIDPAAVRAAAVRRGLMSAEAAEHFGDREALELIFQHGFSTRTAVTDLSGRGVGLDVVRSVIEKLGGTVTVTSEPGKGTRFVLSIPTRLSLERALVLECGGALYGIPSRQVLEVTHRTDGAVTPVPGGEVVRYRDESLPYRSLSALLSSEAVEEPWLLVIVVGMRRWALGCHSIVGEFDLVRQPPDRLLQSSAHVGGSATLDDGRLVLLLSLAALVRRAAVPLRAPVARASAPKRPGRILVVDDSEIIRDLVTHVLRDAGFEVHAAADGGAALALIDSNLPDAILADVEMPVMDGFELLRRVRASWPDLPVVMLTTRSSPEDRSRSAALGANAHLVKSGFQEATLLQTIRGLVDHPSRPKR
jgi:two-component system chemotaxis sensor kinase CheA/two-component system sensor histidine kinase and response regulator WspE